MTYKPTPPVPMTAVHPDDVKNVDRMAEIGITQRAIARQLGVHHRTIHNVIARKGAYAGVPK